MDSLMTNLTIRYYYKEANTKYYKKTQYEKLTLIRKRRKTMNFVGNSTHIDYEWSVNANLDKRLI